MDSTTYEGMIGAAILGDDAEKDRQLIRIDCKLWASHKMFCSCGTIFDQKKIQLLRDQTGKVKSACCSTCRDKAQLVIGEAKDVKGLRGWTWANWNTVVPVCE